MKRSCRMRLKFSFLGWMLMLFFLSMVCKAQSAEPQESVKWYVNATWIGKGEAMLTITAIMNDGCYLYAQTSGDNQCSVPFKIEFYSSLEYSLVGKTKEEQAPVVKYDQLFGRTVSCFDRTAVYTQRVKLNVLSTTVKGNILFMMATANELGIMKEEKFEVKLKMKEVPVQGS